MNGLIYLASPYSSLFPEEMEKRYIVTRAYTLLCMQKGEVIFSPIVYGHQFIDGFGTSAAVWRDFNETVLRSAGKLRVLTLPGWSDSIGIEMEIDFAQSLGIEVEYRSLACA